jgi:hypothetical protein
VNDNRAPLRRGLQGGEIQKVANHEITTEVCNAIEPRRAPHQATDIKTAGAKHAHHNRTDETITASDQDLHALKLVHFAHQLMDSL